MQVQGQFEINLSIPTLDSVLLYPQSGLLCGAALPGAFFLQKKHVPGDFATQISVLCVLLRQYSMGLG